jgi:hypothetical protein
MALVAGTLACAGGCGASPVTVDLVLPFPDLFPADAGADAADPGDAPDAPADGSAAPADLTADAADAGEPGPPPTPTWSRSPGCRPAG